MIRKLMVLGFAAILLLVLAGCGSTGGSSPSTAQPVAQSGTGNWVSVATLSGTADKQGPAFALSGAPAQLTCKVVSSSGNPTLSVYALFEGKSLADSQGTALGLPHEALVVFFRRGTFLHWRWATRPSIRSSTMRIRP